MSDDRFNADENPPAPPRRLTGSNERWRKVTAAEIEEFMRQYRERFRIQASDEAPQEDKP
jgi:hypothetical protein